jgi:hypothetical protein
VQLQLSISNTQGQDRIRFYIKPNSTLADGTSIRVRSLIGATSATGLNEEILFNSSASGPTFVGPPVAPNSYLEARFSSGQSTFLSVTLDLLPPSRMALAASAALAFDLYYSCDAGSPIVTVSANALVVPIVILRAVQANYAGPAFDFGELGGISTSDVLAAASANTITGRIRVSSSGRYRIDVASENGFRLLLTGGVSSRPEEAIAYQLHLADKEMSYGTAPAGATICRDSSGTPIATDLIPLAVTLLEGGRGKVPSSAPYADTLTITITPQASEVSSDTGCDR